MNTPALGVQRQSRSSPGPSGLVRGGYDDAHVPERVSGRTRGLGGDSARAHTHTHAHTHARNNALVEHFEQQLHLLGLVVVDRLPELLLSGLHIAIDLRVARHARAPQRDLGLLLHASAALPYPLARHLLQQTREERDSAAVSVFGESRQSAGHRYVP